jgi:hypothetical protein
VSRAQMAINSRCCWPKQWFSMSATLCGWAELQTMASSHFLVEGWKIYSLNVPKYGRGCTSRERVIPGFGGEGPLRVRLDRKSKVPLRSKTSSFRGACADIVIAFSER